MLPQPAPKLNATPGVSSFNKPYAVCGEHNVEILTSLGYSPNEINELLKNETIFEESKSKL